MLWIHFLQHWFNLSDPAAEEALYDSHALRQFAGIDLGREPVPDWQAANKGIRIAILSGDVRASAAFRLEKKGINFPGYQLTSSAITYHLGWVGEKFAKYALPASEEGKTEDGEDFTRLALSVKSPYSIVQIDPRSGKAVFQLYSAEQTPSHSDPSKTDLRTNSAQTIELG